MIPTYIYIYIIEKGAKIKYIVFFEINKAPKAYIYAYLEYMHINIDF